jgi:hypothetical protein
LELAGRAIDVYPPRASAAAKRLRRWLPMQRWLGRLASTVLGGATRAFPSLTLPRSVSAAFLRMIVPGWPQIYLGHPRRGRIMLAVYVAMLSLGLLFLGTGLGSVALGLAIAVHASSAIDVLWAGSREWQPRLTYAAVVLMGLFYLVYLPAGWLVGRVATPVPIVGRATPFEPGDVVLYNRSAYSRSAPEIGDVVLYRIPPQRFTAPGPGRGPAIYDLRGERIDRVLAGPGQQVTWDNGQLWVDGQPSPWAPLNPQGLLPKLQLTVPAGHYLILPSTEALGYPVEVVTRMSCIPREEILGRVYLRHQPLWRWWWIR